MMMNWLHVLLAYPMMVMMVIAVALALHVRVCACVAIWDISWIAPRTWGWRRGLGAARPPVGQCTRPTSSQFRRAAVHRAAADLHLYARGGGLLRKGHSQGQRGNSRLFVVPPALQGGDLVPRRSKFVFARRREQKFWAHLAQNTRSRDE